MQRMENIPGEFYDMGWIRIGSYVSHRRKYISFLSKIIIKKKFVLRGNIIWCYKLILKGNIFNRVNIYK
jgi:hypothetical protein